MVIIENERIQDIPVLHLAKREIWDTELPLIIFIHGFNSAKEHNLHYAYLMAEKGFRVVLPDAPYHGERSKGHDQQKLMGNFWKIVLGSIKEVDLIKNNFTDRNVIMPDKIGLAGTSMGGIVTLGALAAYDWIGTGVSLMGNPAYVSYAKLQIQTLKKHGIDINLSDQEIEKTMSRLAKYDLSLQQEKLAGRPLMFWHGAKDRVVPYRNAWELYEALLPDYKHSNEKLLFMLDERAEHKVSREGVLKTVEWFGTHLAPAGQNA
ncbi:prolyl oligopeptidase family serine peptidase [Peribacillus glennii]|uniref:Esterase n=1 Tax=Peribacillus glennii TaxID=2303991 RepID=A0A372LAC5_9BACI|nr:prolyl oligopeptidase family serine peptidase [Peribacillus glennii]RFU62169.1 esterase [Peribacillus glennii]